MPLELIEYADPGVLICLSIAIAHTLVLWFA
jgi:hypothetical protein